MDHGGEAARLTTVESTVLGLAGVVQGSESNIGGGTFDGQLGAAAAPTGSFSDFDLSAVHRQTGPGVAYANISEFWQQPGPVHVVLVGPQLPDGVMPVYAVLQTRPGARRGVVLVDLLPGGGGGGGVDADNYAYYALQPRPGVGHGEVLVDLLPDSAGHSEVFVGLLPGDGVAVHDDYGYYPWQPRPGAGQGEVFIGPLPDGVGAVFVNSGSFAQQTLPGTGRADRMAGALRVPNLGAGHDGSEALADDLGTGYDNRGMVAEHLRRLLPFAGIGASSVAINGLAAGPGSPAVAFHLFVLLLGGLFLVTLHVLRV